MAFGHVTEVPTSESFRFPACNFIKKDIPKDVFLWILKNFSKHPLIEHLRMTAS